MIDFSTSPLRRMVYASMFGALTAVGSLLVIPLYPVPISLQTFFTGLAGIILGGYTGALSQIIYILLGIIGLPVFTGGQAGIGTLFGPLGGYLIGFVVGAYVIGKIVEARPEAGFYWTVLALVMGMLVIYSAGTLQLALVGRLSIIKALLAGVVPFLLGDFLKILAAAYLALKLRKYLTA